MKIKGKLSTLKKWYTKKGILDGELEAELRLQVKENDYSRQNAAILRGELGIRFVPNSKNNYSLE